MDALARFWTNVKKIDPDGCWIWSGARTKGGYGEFMVNGKMVYTHRFSFELVNGPIPEGILLDHGPICHNRACVNPSHLRLATDAQNSLNHVIRKDSEVGFKGVGRNKNYNRWYARITINHKTINLGSFPSPEEAHAAYCQAANRLHGQFANYGAAS
ncbi:MAG TPA: HNH endonuclease [Dongiaceae bacterium]|nr:HNH endonuclease [Dongiaceae bacterium]